MLKRPKFIKKSLVIYHR